MWLGIFQPSKKESAQLGKMTKGKATKNVGLKKKKKWNLEALEKERTKSQLSRTPQNGKVSKRLFEERTSKEENNEE